jgi:hypothetical protein
MFANLKKFFTQINDIPAMAKLEQVKLNVPLDAVYVTLSAALVLPEQSPLLSGTHRTMPVTSLADGEDKPMEVAYVLHNGKELKLIREQREIFSTPLTNIIKLQRFMAGGFVLHLSDGRGVALSTPTPVQTDTSVGFKTIQGITDMTGGWLKELEPYGVQVVD